MKAISKRLMAAPAGAAVLAGTAGSVMAQDAAGGMSPWQLGFQASASGVMDDIHWFNNMTLWIITAVTLFVLALLVIVMVRFNARANPTPSRTSHNTMIEVVWTIAPILILVVIAVPSFRLLYKQLDIPAYDMTIKATGYQWYWGYEYTDETLAGISFDSLMLKDDERAAVAEARGVPLTDVPRLLATDYDVVVPVGKTVRVQVTAADVLHAFAMPAFGVKIDAVPGRLNETWFKAEKTGVYYGQCSELCGKDHAFMPITVRVVTQEQFDAWSEAAKSDLDDANKALMASLAAERKVADAALPAQVTAR